MAALLDTPDEANECQAVLHSHLAGLEPLTGLRLQGTAALLLTLRWRQHRGRWYS